MDFLDDINSETLIICNEYIKKLILNRHILKPIKFMNKNEFMTKYFFDYDARAINYISLKYNIRYEIAKEYIDNLFYIEDKTYNNYKLDFLVSLKHDLDQENLLIYNKYFHDYLKRINIIVFDIDTDEFFLNILKKFDYKIVERDYHKYPHKVYEFSTIEEEVNYVIHEIAVLLDSGIKPTDIKLTNVDESYYNVLDRIASLYNIKINIPYKSPLNSYPLVHEFINLYTSSNEDIYNIINKLDNNSVIFDELVKVINKYLIYDDKDLLIYMINHSYITSNKYDNGIEIVNYLDYLANHHEYLFMLGFNEGIIPKNYLDIDYLSDSLKKELLLDDTYSLNKKLKRRIINNIDDTKNLVITYKLRDYKKSYYPSILCQNYEVIKDIPKNNISYSSILDKINLVKCYDEYFKFGYKNRLFDVLNSNYNIKYNSYDNKYTSINRVMDKLNLSYSKMQTYNKCAFKYYLDEVLKLNIFEENFSTIIGSMIHYVMEKCLSNNDNDTDKYVHEFLNGKTFTKKEYFFLNKYKEELHNLLDAVYNEKEYSLFDKAMYEKRIDIDYGDNIHFVGIIDKILYYIKDNKTYIALIDYKTGYDDIKLKYFKYGIDIQLPIYLYLSSKLDFYNITYTGFYLQKFNLTEKDYRLVGYSNSDKDILSIIDREYDNSKIIKGLKTISDGSFARTSKVLSNEEIEKIKDKTEEIIKTTLDKIRNNQFQINPKVDNGINIGCTFCKYKDICFNKQSDWVKITAEDIEDVI